jgi:hypothetical protein
MSIGSKKRRKTLKLCSLVRKIHIVDKEGMASEENSIIKKQLVRPFDCCAEEQVMRQGRLGVLWPFLLSVISVLFAQLPIVPCWGRAPGNSQPLWSVGATMKAPERIFSFSVEKQWHYLFWWPCTLDLDLLQLSLQ